MRIKLNDIIVIGSNAYRPVMEKKYGFEVYSLYLLDFKDDPVGEPVRQAFSFEGLCRSCYELMYKQTGFSLEHEDMEDRSIDYSNIKKWS